jgi:hypothetical protein
LVEAFREFARFIDAILVKCSWKPLVDSLVKSIAAEFFELVLAPRLQNGDRLRRVWTYHHIAELLNCCTSKRLHTAFAQFLPTVYSGSVWSIVLSDLVSPNDTELSKAALKVIYKLTQSGDWEVIQLLVGAQLKTYGQRMPMPRHLSERSAYDATLRLLKAAPFD